MIRDERNGYLVFIMFTQLIPAIDAIRHIKKSMHSTFDKDGNRERESAC